jgi:Na+-driven multidrug efflux pump
MWQGTWLFSKMGRSFAIDLALIGEILRANIPFLIYGVLMVGYYRIDTIILSLMTNTTIVGWYGATTRLYDALIFLPNIVITNIMYPVFSKLSTDSDTSLKLAIEKSLNFLLFCGIPITTIFIVAAPQIIGFLYGGDGFTPAIPALQALAPAVTFLYIDFAFSSMILSKRQEKKLPMMATIALAFNIGLNLILIPLYQASGAAIVTSLTELLLCCMCIFFMPRHLLPFGSLRVGFKALIASLIMVLVILPLHSLNIIVLLPIAALVYLGVSTLIGTIPREDYLVVYHAIRRKAQHKTIAISTAVLETPVPSDNAIPETPVPFANPLPEVESATTLKLPAIWLQPLPSYYANPLLDIEFAPTTELAAIQQRSVRQRQLKAVRLQSLRQFPLTQQGQLLPLGKESTENHEGTRV